MTGKEKFIKKALKQGYIYEKKKLSNGSLVEQPFDLNEKDFNKSLFLNM